MRFWDSSAVVPLLVAEASSSAALDAFGKDPQLVAWWGTELECVSALVRRERDGVMDEGDVSIALARLADLAASWVEIAPSTPLRRTAFRLLRVHSVGTADALQLAAAITGSEGQPETLPFVTLDERLALAAEREGFRVTRFALDG